LIQTGFETTTLASCPVTLPLGYQNPIPQYTYTYTEKQKVKEQTNTATTIFWEWERERGGEIGD